MIDWQAQGQLTRLDWEHEMNAEVSQVLREVAGKSVCARQQRKVMIETVVRGSSETARLTDTATKALLEPL